MLNRADAAAVVEQIAGRGALIGSDGVVATSEVLQLNNVVVGG